MCIICWTEVLLYIHISVQMASIGNRYVMYSIDCGLQDSTNVWVKQAGSRPIQPISNRTEASANSQVSTGLPGAARSIHGVSMDHLRGLTKRKCSHPAVSRRRRSRATTPAQRPNIVFSCPLVRLVQKPLVLSRRHSTLCRDSTLPRHLSIRASAAGRHLHHALA
jgi:hypothetical protein